MKEQSYVALQQPFSPWCNSRRKRLLDLVLASLALAVTAPLMLVTAVAIRVTSGSPVLFRQWRSGWNGRPFQLLKFRTMQIAAVAYGPGVTRSGDARITRLGRWLRRWKLDELPQLINVFFGEMSMVGPRPDLEQYWLQSGHTERQALATKPGITGAASLIFRNEEDLLAQVPESELTTFYLRRLLPRKARLDRDYAAQATFWTDCRVLTRTLFHIFSNDSGSPEFMETREQRLRYPAQRSNS
ncbi:MAG TPA: sugar transferase [Candidatus Angelobacter sp.]|nr:sugar transferase [Candidatus Angelobacter sp.]